MKPTTQGKTTNGRGEQPNDMRGREADASGSGFATVGIVRVEAHDADELGEVVRDWNVEFKQFKPGRLEAVVTMVRFGPALVCSGHFSHSLLQHVGSPNDCLSVSRPGRGSDPLTVQGHEIHGGEAFVAGPGAECEVLSHGAHFPTTLSVRLDFLETQTDWLGDSRMQPLRGIRLHGAGMEWTSHFLDSIEWIVAAVARYPAIISTQRIRGSLLDNLLARVNVLGATDSPLSEHREMRSARRVAVERAREYIHQNLTEPIRLSDLCKYAYTQARSLEYGFREAMGVSPIAYIRASRLHLARELLQSTAVRSRSISEIALDCGFWHLSQFAVDYKRLFAESPSATYRRTCSQLPRRERRDVSGAACRFAAQRSGNSEDALAVRC